ncbi:hypothetical protein [Propylenella binzhouense]|uniref:DUF945 family protein n=1 Tax=Propylenella binzhouense TaxID=2555902 RepID=A0A964WU54_9HYPH|nr:hypothetical protein [Propylenella binzhouense]MYZ48500.1 hypothetical protein [Propylenella binzhouense]
MLPTRMTASALVGLVAVALSFDSAAAIEPQAAARILATALANGVENAGHFEEATQEGSDVVVKGLTFGGESGENAVRFERTVIASPAEGTEFALTSPKITMSSGAVTGETSGTVAEASITNARILPEPAGAAPDPAGRNQRILYDSAEASGLSLRGEDAPADVTIARIVVNTANYTGSMPQESDGRIESLVIPSALFQGLAFSPQMLGYDSIVLDVSWDGRLDAETKLLDIQKLDVTMENGGVLTFSGQVGNVPLSPSAESVDAAGLASQLVVHKLTLRYEDQSLARRVLDDQARRQGVPPDQYAQQLSAALPFLLMTLNNPEFQNQVAGAVGSFLTDPQSLTVEIAPAAPLTGAEILEVAATAPQSLPDKLNAKVTANTPE